MAGCHGRHGQDGSKVLDPPVVWNEGTFGKDNHADDRDECKRHAVLEPLEHLRDFNEEVGEFGFFRGRAPGHVDFEHVRKQGRGDVERKAAEEDGEHEDPFDVLHKSTKEGLLTNTISLSVC